MKTKDIKYYMNLSYTITVRKEDEVFIARIVELQGCLAHGENEADAISHLRQVQRLWLEDALEAGESIPVPDGDCDLPSGKWVQRVPRRLHRQLTIQAQRDNVSLNQLVTSMLSEAMAHRSYQHTFMESVIAYLGTQQRGQVVHNYWLEPALENWSRLTPNPRGSHLVQRLGQVKHLCQPALNTQSTQEEEYVEART